LGTQYRLSAHQPQNLPFAAWLQSVHERNLVQSRCCREQSRPKKP
jgi:hypothetical protein